MDLHFGYNCINYLPTMNKCRVLIDNYRTREDLITIKWLSMVDILIYLNLSFEELIKKIKEGDVKVKVQKEGKPVFSCSSAWQYDDCILGNAGGQCYYFKPHNGRRISYLMEMKGIEMMHPNVKSIPSDESIKRFESEIAKFINTMSHDINDFELKESDS